MWQHCFFSSLVNTSCFSTNVGRRGAPGRSAGRRIFGRSREATERLSERPLPSLKKPEINFPQSPELSADRQLGQRGQCGQETSERTNHCQLDSCSSITKCSVLKATIERGHDKMQNEKFLPTIFFKQFKICTYVQLINNELLAFEKEINKALL